MRSRLYVFVFNEMCVVAVETAELMPELWWVKFCFDLSVTGQSEDGADQDSPEEGTPASPRNKRRVGRPGRKRKQLLPVSTCDYQAGVSLPSPPLERSSGSSAGLPLQPLCSTHSPPPLSTTPFLTYSVRHNANC